MASVELVDVSKRYGSVIALDGLTLDIAHGEFVSLLGPSGGGKTTTLRILAGFDSPDRGTVSIGGVPMARIPAHARATATVWQNYALFPHMTIAENVGYGLKEHGLDRTEIGRRVDRVLELVDLPKTGRRRPHELSGGQQQRVALARALAVEPQVLLLDEPLGALDGNLRRRMQDELRAIQRRLGMTFIYVTHDQDEALSMSDRVAILRAGKIEQIGSPRDLYERPASDFVATFIGEGNVVDGRALSADGTGAVVQVAGRRLPVAGSGLRANDPVRVLLRPERLAIRRAEGNADGTGHGAGWEATVVATRYRGATTNVIARLDDGTDLLVSGRPPDLGAYAPGDAVVVIPDGSEIWAFRHANADR